MRRLVFGATCREVSEFLLEYLEGELLAAQRRAFRRHLFWCRDCVRYIESYRRTLELARQTGSSEAPDAAVPIPERLVRAILAAKRAGDG
jgi:anti-sigma factor RsiW